MYRLNPELVEQMFEGLHVKATTVTSLAETPRSWFAPPSNTSGTDAWHTFAIPRLGIPAIRITDGPNGARGTRYFNGVPSACLPCGTALGATFDTDLVFKLGRLLAAECKAKGAHVLLGPTINIQRGPLGGRGFESFSEDPVLSGNSAASYCAGVKDLGIVPTLKHLVCNDQEHERIAVSAMVTERALREIYLMPFQLAIKNARPGALMTSYNKVNGLHASEDPGLLDHIIRKEWGYEGLIMSDWFGTYSVASAVNAGLDLEMPGPTRFRGPALMHALTSNKVSEKTLDDRVRKVLELVQLTSRAGIPGYAPAQKLDRVEDRALLRQAAADSIVLLKNDNEILPLDPRKKTLVIGPNADIAAYCGGGSASLLAYYTVTPRQGIAEKCEEVIFSQGCYGHKELPLLGDHLKTETGERGYTFRVYTEPASYEDRQPVDVLHMTNSCAFLMDYSHPKISGDTYYATLEGRFEPPESGVYEFGLTVAGTGLLYIDGELVIDNKTKQRHGTSFFGIGTVEERRDRYLKAGRQHHVFVEYSTAPTSNLKHHGVVSFGPGGVRLGGCRKLDAETAIKQAVHLAAEIEQVVVCVGLSGDWESEGFDRPHMNLPPGTDNLVRAVLVAQPNAVIVVQSGTPVTMPWADQAKALLQAWYGGSEGGNGIADVLFGDVNPSAKLPLTFPRDIAHNPSYLSYRSERGRVLYSEDVYVGYRYYDKVKQAPLFRFGHGLSYTTFQLSGLDVQETAPQASDIRESSISVRAWVTNTGPRAGAEVVQIYVRPPTTASVGRPVRELKGYEKTMLHPGETKEISVTVPMGLATSFWDEGRSAWLSEKGIYAIEVVGTGVRNILSAPLCVQVSRYWNGL
ncbi:glycoside hydrolase superfamily [Aspergillus tetrazonus]